MKFSRGRCPPRPPEVRVTVGQLLHDGHLKVGQVFAVAGIPYALLVEDGTADRLPMRREEHRWAINLGSMTVFQLSLVLDHAASSIEIFPDAAIVGVP